MRSFLFPFAATVLLAGTGQAQAFFFDSFEGPFPGNWVERATPFGPGPHVTTPAAALGGSLGVVGTGGWIENLDATSEVWATFTVWTQIVSSQRTYLGFDATAAGCKSFVFSPNTGDIRFQDNPAYGFIELNVTPFTAQIGTWYRMEVRLRPGGVAEGRLFDSDGVTQLAMVTQNYGTFSGGGVALRVGFTNPGHNGDLVEAATVSDALDFAPPTGAVVGTPGGPAPRTVDTNTGAATELIVTRLEARYDLKVRGEADEPASVWIVEINGQPTNVMLGAGTLGSAGTMHVALPRRSLPPATELRLRAMTGNPPVPTADQVIRTR